MLTLAFIPRLFKRALPSWVDPELDPWALWPCGTWAGEGVSSDHRGAGRLLPSQLQKIPVPFIKEQCQRHLGISRTFNWNTSFLTCLRSFSISSLQMCRAVICRFFEGGVLYWGFSFPFRVWNWARGFREESSGRPWHLNRLCWHRFLELRTHWELLGGKHGSKMSWERRVCLVPGCSSKQESKKVMWSQPSNL